MYLKPPHHELPDNVWHTGLILILASMMVWLAGVEVIDSIGVEEPVSATEIAVAQGEGHPFFYRLFEFFPDADKLFWGRLVSLAGLVYGLWSLARYFAARGELITAVPPLVLFLTAPELAIHLSAAGSGVWGGVFFIKFIAAVDRMESHHAWLLGGAYAALAAGCHAAWLWPVCGAMIGLWEMHRSRMGKTALAFAGAMVGVTLVLGWASPANAFLAGTFSDRTFPSIGLQAWALVLGCYLLMLLKGAVKRGFLWWSLVMCLPLLALRDPSVTAWMPLAFCGAIALGKLPRLIGLRHPRAYQSLLLFQLLLWLPFWLALRDFS